MSYTKASAIDDESTLLTPSINSGRKTQMGLSYDLSPNNYKVPYEDNLRDTKRSLVKKNTTYYPTRDIGAGRGFGNLDVSNNIRNGGTEGSSRSDFKKFKEIRESKQFFEHNFQYLDKNFQNPNNVVLPFPRGGEMTRKNVQLTQKTRPMNIVDENNFDFSY